MSDRPDDDREARLARSWDANADAWNEAVRDGRIESRRLATDDAVTAAVIDRGGGRVLDVGCGEGWLARRLAEHGATVTGFDGSERLIEIARAQGGATYHRLSYEAFARAPERVGAGFDLAVANFSLLGRALDGVLRGVGEVVRPGGWLVVQTVHPDGAGEGWREEELTPLAPLDFEPMPWYPRTVDGWRSALAAAGWSVVEAREPRHPASVRPLSLILVARNGAG